jgi:hypothetical protein
LYRSFEKIQQSFKREMVILMKRMLASLLLIISGLGVGLFIAELGLRLADISYPAFHRADNLTGIALIAGAEGWYRTEGEAYVRINNAGFRDQDHTKEKPANTLRIAVLGDSFVEALQVPLESTFWTVAGQELQGCSWLGKQRIEVLNFGVSGYGTAQELLTLRHNVWGYNPDIVMLAFTTGNDVSDNSRKLKQLKQLKQSKFIPYFVYQGDELILDNSFLESDSYVYRRNRRNIDELINYSRLLQFLRNVKRLSENNWQVKRPNFVTADQEDLFEPGLLAGIYREPPTPEWREAWRLTEDLIVLMRDEVVVKKAEFIVVTLSNGIQVHPDSTVRERFKDSLGVMDLFYPDMRIKSLGEREGFPVITLAPLMWAYTKKNQTFVHGFENTRMGIGHWNDMGHRLAGQLIAEEICRKHLSIDSATTPHFE